MGFERWSALVGQHRRTMILVAMLTTFAGVALLIDRPKGTVLEWFALPLTAVGGAIFAWAVWPRFALPQEASQSLASHLLRHLTVHGRLVRLFPPIGVGIQVTVVITTACSGIYSFGIFASAFVAFVLTEYDRLTGRIWLLLALGLMSSYIANVLRMVVIVLVGYYADSGQADLQNMLIAHSYAGWIIFLAWIALFWGALLKFLPEARPSLTAGAQLGTPARKESRCGICSIPLSPSLPATRCV